MALPKIPKISEKVNRRLETLGIGLFSGVAGNAIGGQYPTRPRKKKITAALAGGSQYVKKKGGKTNARTRKRI